MNTGDTRILVHPPQTFGQQQVQDVQEHAIHVTAGAEKKELVIDGASNDSLSTLTITVDADAQLDLQVLITAQAAQHNIQIIGLIAGELNLTLLQELGDEAMSKVTRELHITGKAHVHDVLLGGTYTDFVSKLYLEAKDAVGKQSATIFGSNQKFNLNQQSYHLVGETSSDILTKCVLQHKAKAGLKGLVGIAKGAPESAGYQSMNVLLLDETANANAIPELAIETDKVSCSHGATIGKLDAEQLFYLQARGMNKKQAQHLLVRGFLQQSMQHLSEEQQERLLEIIDARLVL